MLVGVTNVQRPAYHKQSPHHPIAMKRELKNYCLGKYTDVQLDLHISHDKLFTVFWRCEKSQLDDFHCDYSKAQVIIYISHPLITILTHNFFHWCRWCSSYKIDTYIETSLFSVLSSTWKNYTLKREQSKKSSLPSNLTISAKISTRTNTKTSFGKLCIRSAME